MNIDLLDARSLFEKMMNHFGWYKTQMSELKVDRLEVDYHFIIEVPEELKNAINQEQVAKSSRQEHRSRNQGRQTTKTSSSNRPVRKTSSRKEG
jgi:uncharacterized protein YdeI (YjbR/CyaY-like superfamily)